MVPETAWRMALAASTNANLKNVTKVEKVALGEGHQHAYWGRPSPLLQFGLSTAKHPGLRLDRRQSLHVPHVNHLLL